MFEALFKSTLVTIVVIGAHSLYHGEFVGWIWTIGSFSGLLVGNLIYQRIRDNKSKRS